MLLNPAFRTSFSPLYASQEPGFTAWPFSLSTFEQLERELQTDLHQMRRTMNFMNEIFQQLSDDVLEKRKLPVDKPQTRREKDPGSRIQNDEKGFSLSLDVKQFSPEELNVKVAGRKVTVEGKHEMKSEDGETVFSYECNRFKKEVLLPEDVNSEEVTCLLSHNGELVIAAPRLSSPAVTGRDIPISITTDKSSGKEDENENADKTDNNRKQETSSNEGNEAATVQTD
ncbi:heat shock protein beta-11-like [Protopterus annectens]|uniref:heat shock protein beta-11-like n=1 Tax=Protopterus annectens TaxID=7888 RepID=UPI001CFB9952|nr:heat shock protein beta-11-like [Protopterus annectens]